MTRLIVMACCGVFVATLVMSAEHAADPAAIDREHASESVQSPTDCGGEPCDAVLRGLSAFFDRHPHGLDGNGRSCADCHMPTTFPAVAVQCRSAVPVPQWRRRWDSNADDPLFRRSMRMISHQRRERHAISATCGRTVWSEYLSAARRTSGSSFRGPTRCRPRHSWTCGVRSQA